MENKVKIILTLVGLSAILVPAVLLMVFSKKDQDTSANTGLGDANRQLRQDLIQNELDKNPLKQVVVTPSPYPSPIYSTSPKPTPTQVPFPTPPLESTPASGVN